VPDPLRHSLKTLALVFLGLLLPASASATNFEVDTLDDQLNLEGCVYQPAGCSLRDAIERANETPEADEITFANLFHGTIELDYPLPPIAHPVTIDATTAADYSDAGHPVIVLDGRGYSLPEDRGLEVAENAGGTRIEGLAVGGFRTGIFIYSEATSYVCGNYLGVEPDGETALPNEYAGISTGTIAVGTRIGFECDGNLISGNGEFGILEAGQGTKIAGNEIGVGADGDPLPNGSALLVSAGIEVNAAAQNPTIGGTEPGEGNLIAHNAGQGIRVRDAASAAAIRNNSIHNNLLPAIQIDSGTQTAAPLFEYSSIVTSTTEVLGTIQGLAGEDYELDIFVSKTCGQNAKEAELFLGEAEVATDSGGAGIWSASGLPKPPAGSEFFTATATAVATGATSVLSNCQDTPPDTEITASPGDPTTATEAEFEFTGKDFNGSVKDFLCKLDGGGFMECGSPKSYDGLGDGSHSFEVAAFDQAGTPDFSPATYTWTVDTTAPSVQIDSKPASPSSSPRASFSFSGGDGNGSGVAGFECRLDDGAFSACNSPQAYDSLAVGAHSFQVRSVDDVGHRSAAASHEWTIESAAPLLRALAAPVNGESVAVAPQDGVVKVKAPGKNKFTILQEGQTIPVGSLVDATNGKVTLTSVNAAGETQTAVFYGGKFLVAQHEGSGLVILKLRGGSFASCKGGARQPGAQVSARSGRRLWGSGKGKFRTEGNYGSATVRGTVWLTEDRCEGTFFKVRRGVVSVRDFVLDKTLALGAGKSYLAGRGG